MNAADRLDSIDARLERIAVTTERQARNIERQAKAIETLVSGISELSRTTNAAMHQDRITLMELFQRSTQASEATLALFQSNQVAIRDLIEELRQG
ncbi:MAG: hypothetical protein WCA07_16460 [Gloeobacterales cyanobacterium]